MVEKVFEGIKRRLREMTCLPNDSHHMGFQDYDCVNSLTTPLTATYVKHGWPNPFLKEECAATVKQLFGHLEVEAGHGQRLELHSTVSCRCPN